MTNIENQETTGEIQKLQDGSDWLPVETINYKGKERCVGIEIEFAGVAPDDILRCLQAAVGGKVRVESPALSYLDDTEWGTFKVELDASYIQQLNDNKHESVITEKLVDILTWAAEQIVPWEIVTPPIPVSELWKVPGFINDFRKLGALGTRHSLHYAFAVHYNPDLPSLDVETILKYFRAYLCLYDWIVTQDNTDTARKVAQYISHFEYDYINLVINHAYQPSMEQFIEDYLAHNRTRNRSLDLLPLLSHINEAMVKEAINDPRIKKRPTFHYRLSNCEIDNVNWNIGQSWYYWLQVEKLAFDNQKLSVFMMEFGKEIHRSKTPFDNQWADRCDVLLRSECPTS